MHHFNLRSYLIKATEEEKSHRETIDIKDCLNQACPQRANVLVLTEERERKQMRFLMGPRFHRCKSEMKYAERVVNPASSETFG